MPLARAAPNPPFTGSGTSRQVRSWFYVGSYPPQPQTTISNSKYVRPRLCGITRLQLENNPARKGISTLIEPGCSGGVRHGLCLHGAVWRRRVDAHPLTGTGQTLSTAISRVLDGKAVRRVRRRSRRTDPDSDRAGVPGPQVAAGPALPMPCVSAPRRPEGRPWVGLALVSEELRCLFATAFRHHLAAKPRLRTLLLAGDDNMAGGLAEVGVPKMATVERGRAVNCWCWRLRAC
jgi:hypothetical protein